VSFADSILTEDMQSLRQRLLYHPLWTGIEQGTLERERLRVFALQDWWLVGEAYRLDALAVAGGSDLEVQELLLAKLLPKVGGSLVHSRGLVVFHYFISLHPLGAIRFK
jgi:thiaminase/transcriptional activator TenA